MPWNFLIHSGGLKAIDYNIDPNGFAYPDGLCLGLVKDIVSAASYIPDVPAETELPLTPSGKSGDIITSGFNPTSPHSMRPASSGALVALHHAFVPGSSLNVMLSVQPSSSFEIAVFANNMACTLERDTANPTYDRLTIHVPSDVSLLNYPLLLRFEIKQLEPEATEMPDFYSLSYKLNDIAPH